MYHMSAQCVDDRMINVHYYYHLYIIIDLRPYSEDSRIEHNAAEEGAAPAADTEVAVVVVIVVVVGGGVFYFSRSRYNLGAPETRL